MCNFQFSFVYQISCRLYCVPQLTVQVSTRTLFSFHHTETYFQKMDSLKGAKLIKADGSSVDADSVLADKVNKT